MHATNEAKSVKKLRGIQRSVDRHWVGNGFPVRTLLLTQIWGRFSVRSYCSLRRPYGVHADGRAPWRRRDPHRGFETVTIVYEGAVEHQTLRGGGEIGPGDVQWMTAASGLVHEEFHGRDFARRGGMFEMVQLWVNLPAKDKMAPPRYQSIVSSQIPTLSLRRPRSRARHRWRVRGVEGTSQHLHAPPRVGPPPRE